MRQRIFVSMRLISHWSLGATFGACLQARAFTGLAWFLLGMYIGSQLVALATTKGASRVVR